MGIDSREAEEEEGGPGECCKNSAAHLGATQGAWDTAVSDGRSLDERDSVEEGAVVLFSERSEEEAEDHEQQDSDEREQARHRGDFRRAKAEGPDCRQHRMAEAGGRCGSPLE